MLRKNILFLFLSLFTGTFAQQSNTLYFMDQVPQSLFLNPARQFPCRVYVGMPLLSSIHLNYGNTAFSLSTLASREGDMLIFTTDNILKRIHKLDHISTEFHYTLLSFGFWKKDYYFSFGLTEKNEVYLSLPRDLFGFALNGNGAYIGENIDLNRIGVNVLHYREYAFGVSRKIWEDLTVGFRAKLLFGKVNVNTRKSDIKIFTDPNTYDLSFSSNARINSSFPLIITTGANGIIQDVAYDESANITKLILNRSNPGLSLDGGFFYQYDDRLTYSASFNDLGMIWWRSYVNNATQSSDSSYTGAQPGSVPNDGNFFVTLFDSARSSIPPVFTQESYFTMLPLKLYGGAEYKVFPKLKAGALARLWYYQFRFHPSLILSATYTPFRFISTTLTYSYNNYTFNNLGLGLSLQSRNFQFYVVSDNATGFKWWESARNINFRFGMNLSFGCKKKKTEADTDCAGCYWYQMAQKKKERNKAIRK